MHALFVLLPFAGLHGLLFVALGAYVVRQRFLTRQPLGEGEIKNPAHKRLRCAVRAHGNFAEHVPFIFLLLAGDALLGMKAPWLRLLAGGLFVMRLSHIAGIHRPAPNALRATGVIGTWLILLAASLYALAA